MMGVITCFFGNSLKISLSINCKFSVFIHSIADRYTHSLTQIRIYISSYIPGKLNVIKCLKECNMITNTDDAFVLSNNENTVIYRYTMNISIVQGRNI